MLIAVDVGRSSTKVSYFKEGDSKAESFEIPSLVATSFSSFSRPDSALVNSYSDAEVSQIEVKATQGGWNKDFADFFMFGKQAQKQGGAVSAFSEGSQFHKFGVAMILFVVAKVSDSTRDAKISLAINLTYSNNEAVSFYSSALKGKHTVALGKVKGGRIVGDEISFTISDLYCFQQGYASVFNFINTEHFDLVQHGRGVIVDIGRFTVDFSKVEELTLVDGTSVDYGTRYLITRLLEEISQSSGVKLTVDEVERSFIQRKLGFSNLSGKQVCPWELLQKSSLLDEYYKAIKIALNNFVGEERIDYVILCGGGSHLIDSRFSKDYRIQILPLDYVRSNVSGMLKMLSIQ